MSRVLIVNADDFGRSEGVNRGIARAHEHGIVTSASLMVRFDAAAEAAEYARAHSDLSVGLHVDLGEWAYRDGAWVPVYEVVPPGDAAAVADEVARQLAAFRRLVGQDPTHLDSHQHVHLAEPVRSVLATVADELGVPLRGCNPIVRYCGSFYGQTGKCDLLPDAITVEALVKLLAVLPPGITELGCHPGEGDELRSSYSTERSEEVNALCDARVRMAISDQGIQLYSFHDI